MLVAKVGQRQPAPPGERMLARRGQAQIVVQRTADVVRAALQAPDVRETWERTGLLVESSTPAQLLAAMRSENAFWGPVIKASGFTPER